MTAVAVPEFPPLCATLAARMFTPFTVTAEIVFVEVSSPPDKLPPDAVVVDAPAPCDAVTLIVFPFCAVSFVLETKVMLLPPLTYTDENSL